MITYYENYTPVADILVIAIAIVLFALILATFVTKNKNFFIFQSMLLLVVVAAVADMLFHISLNHIEAVPVWLIYALRNVYHIALFSTFYGYISYTIEMLGLEGAVRRKFFVVINLGMVVFALLDILGAPLGYSFHFMEDGEIERGTNIFAPAYVFFIGILVFLLLRYRHLLVPQIMRGLLFTVAFCILFQGVQGSHHQMSFTTASFLFPILALMFLMHSNPYELETGAVNERSFEHAIQDAYIKQRELVLISLYMYELRKTTYTPQMRFQAYHFYQGIVKKGVLFRVSGGRLVLVFRKDKNPEYEKAIEQLVEAFSKLHKNFKKDYKAVIMESRQEFSRNNDYQKLIWFMESQMSFNICYRVTGEDLLRFEREQFIEKQLEDIARKKDFDDARVLPYCQPVYHVAERRYDTAEALMRLELPQIGFVLPDEFVPLAEENGFVHILSLIILNKTCRLLREFMDEQLWIQRISVNISMEELREEEFCSDILRIIEKNHIPYDRIAIELTESRNEKDFQMVKSRIDELRTYGIKLYLDDFGTGYSNFERIMELPFDIIKFDRSLVIESAKNEESKFMVQTFADMFRKLDYCVLYEGIEDETDEERCIHMLAQYLQGYKYSKPIAMERLREFLSPVEEAS